MKLHTKFLLIGCSVGMWFMCATIALAQDPLPSWNDGAAKQNIMEFVEKVTKEGLPLCLPPKCDSSTSISPENRVSSSTD